MRIGCNNAGLINGSLGGEGGCGLWVKLRRGRALKRIVIKLAKGERGSLSLRNWEGERGTAAKTEGDAVFNAPKRSTEVKTQTLR